MNERYIRKKFRMEPLTTPERLADARKLIHGVFPEEAAKKLTPGDALQASLYGDKKAIKKFGIRELQYFLLIDKAKDAVVGTTGLYAPKRTRRDTIWLGWFCVAHAYRGERLGTFILSWTVAEAKRRGFKKLRLYTSTTPNESAAQFLYESLDFKVIGEEKRKEGGYCTLYREKKL